MMPSAARKSTAKIIVMISTLLLTAPGFGQNTIEGDWMLYLYGPGIGNPGSNEAKPSIEGKLSLNQAGRGWTGHVEGGPVSVDTKGNQIEILVDSRDLAGFRFFRRLQGEFTGQAMMGSFTIEGYTEQSEPGGSWIAKRFEPPQPSQTRGPVDITGIWTPAPGVDFRKYSMDLTDEAASWFENYLAHYDHPNVRCVSPGIVAMVAWGAYPFEILDSMGRLTFLYEVDSEVRRIYMNGKAPPEYYPPSAMGFSNGNWNGGTLTIETQLLEGNIRDFRGEPVSEGARMHEQYQLSEDGNTLSAVITLLDPKNYKQPPIRRRKWVRNSATEIYPYECDPDSFYRQMYNEDKLDMYFGRSQRRLIE
ncbi:MAG: hypothetical protein HOL98_13470 [Gammaproteobacteria bacterium]|jgi:hypothetical protein|nr:hypothetical protein [Gammaproteobacteria bacterium]MBT5204460.1 hypothetical protein [Gammaproteobacteria bacterium]MBT5604097.1 hypothetical protein [Gammaproteobacteria bacterium]MBT6246799.1 hypothetical protein [Gammaproteobacteria bacterium]